MTHLTITNVEQAERHAEMHDAPRDLAVVLDQDGDGRGWVGWAVSAFTGRDSEFDIPVGEAVFFDRRDDAATFAALLMSAIRV
ncbi:MAG: hypothetical protein JRD89_03465 [Deltaproteobacteria bacterium]|nr:hypothetical protein [Deltaproteobacteria bacterium]